ncbi:MAG: malonate decarboxylase holo-ACP synthase [Pararobbsia sp.]
MILTPHDLLRIAPVTWDDAPDWVEASLSRAPFVVVRRARAAARGPGPERIAVGVRGATRRERFGTWIDADPVLEVIKPEDLRSVEPAHWLPVFSLLDAIRPVCEATSLCWGPTGSAGFELASGAATATETSDLDLLMRAPVPLDAAFAAALFARLDEAAWSSQTRIDIQIETGRGAFSLAEFVRPHRHVMMRGPDGPRLVADPWHEHEEAPS